MSALIAAEVEAQSTHLATLKIVGVIVVLLGIAFLAFPARFRRLGNDTPPSRAVILINRIIGIAFVIVGVLLLVLGIN